jgi:dGTPase
MEMQNELSDSQLKSRLVERACDVRGAYYRDTTAIIHSSPFRRLKHKTQVFFAPSNDHICTRMEHCLHVASIASTICRGLELNTELAWAIGMGHDLGHTPFGHTGEKILSGFMEKDGFGPFEHEINSLRVVDFLCEHGKGLNLTYAVRDGIVCHNGESLLKCLKPEFVVKDLSALKQRKNLIPSTYEGVVVRFSDSIAYLGRDFEDASRLNIVKKEQLPSLVLERLGSSNAEIIDTLVTDVIEHSNPKEGIQFSDELFPAVQAMIRFNYEHIYKSPMLEGYERYFSRLLRLIIDYLKMLLEVNGFSEEGYVTEKNMLAMGFYHHLEDMKESYREHDGSIDLLIYDYVAGMSDNFCLDCANEILKPEHLNDSIEHSLTGKWFDARSSLNS